MCVILGKVQREVLIHCHNLTPGRDLDPSLVSLVVEQDGFSKGGKGLAFEHERLLFGGISVF